MESNPNPLWKPRQADVLTETRTRGVLRPAPPLGLFEQRLLGRRRFVAGMLGTAVGALALAACGSSDDDASGSNAEASNGAATGASATDAPFPPPVPPGTKLAINDGSTAGQSQQLRLRLAGLLDKLPFQVSEWTNLSGGPQVINGFRAGSTDLATNAGIPPIQSHYIGGIDARIVGVSLNRTPTYAFITRPGSDIQSVADFKGKKLAFSEGQAQGIVLLRALIGAGIDLKDVDLVHLTSTQFITALQASQVDVAVVGIGSVFQYLNQYGKDGARRIDTDVVDLLGVLWAPGSVFKDEAKVAAVAAYVPIWAQGEVWEYEHPDIWIDEYYIKQEGLSREQAEATVKENPKPVFPNNWDEAIAWEQETADLMASAGVIDKFDASTLFDRRFEKLASQAVPETYWT
jgi:sulfonate transport system substrate-binding protein